MAARWDDRLSTLTDGAADHGPAVPAIVDGDAVIAAADLAAESRRLAGALAALGVGAGDRVAIWLPNVPAWLALLFACARLGAIAVALNTRFRSAEVGDIVGRSGAKLLVLWPGFKGIDFAGILADVPPADLAGLETIVCYGDGVAEHGTAAVPGKQTVPYADLRRHAPYAGDVRDAAAPALIFTTSGTTKAPKFVLHSQASLTRHAREVARGFGYDAAQSVMLQSLPFCGTFGLTQALASLAARRPMVLQRLFDAGEAVSLIRRHRVTTFNASDEMVLRLLDAAGTIPFESLRYVAFASFGAALDDLVARTEACRLTLLGLYGASELQALFARQPLDAAVARRATAGGFPVSAEAEVRVRDSESGQLLPAGAPGELEITGPSRMLEYFGDPAATARTLTDDGYVRTGDLGYLGPDGSFVFLSRLGDGMRLGGFLVAPAEIEACLQSHPAIAQAQVVAVSTGAGPRAVAFVILASGAAFDEAAVQAHCARRLARYKVPARIVPVAAFPVTKSANGEKVQRAKLRDMAAALGL